MKGLDAAFGTFFDTRKPRGARQVNDMQIKLAKFRVAFTWECHQTEDELFPVHNGRLLTLKERTYKTPEEAGEALAVGLLQNVATSAQLPRTAVQSRPNPLDTLKTLSL